MGVGKKSSLTCLIFPHYLQVVINIDKYMQMMEKIKLFYYLFRGVLPLRPAVIVNLANQPVSICPDL